jgi:hypothetical protein
MLVIYQIECRHVSGFFCQNGRDTLLTLRINLIRGFRIGSDVRTDNFAVEPVLPELHPFKKKKTPGSDMKRIQPDV